MVSLGSFAGGLGTSLQTGFAARERERAQRGQLEEQRRGRQAKARKGARDELIAQVGQLDEGITRQIETLTSLRQSQEPGAQRGVNLAQGEKAIVEAHKTKSELESKLGVPQSESFAALQSRLDVARTAKSPQQVAEAEASAKIKALGRESEALAAARVAAEAAPDDTIAQAKVDRLEAEFNTDARASVNDILLPILDDILSDPQKFPTPAQRQVLDELARIDPLKAFIRGALEQRGIAPAAAGVPEAAGVGTSRDNPISITGNDDPALANVESGQWIKIGNEVFRKQ